MKKTIPFSGSQNKSLPYVFSLEKIKHKHPFYHPDLEIIFVIKGTVKIEIEDEKHILNEGDFLLINAGFVHTIDNDDYALTTSFYLNLTYFEKYFPTIRGYSFYCYYLDGDESEANVYHTIRNFLIRLMIIEDLKISQGKEISNEICTMIMDILVNHVIDAKYLKQKVSNIKDTDVKRIFSISRYIIEHFKDKGFSLSQVAANENLSITRLSHFWKEMVGISLMDSVNMNRYHESKRMLMNTDTSISEIAEVCGYSDEKYLYKIFKDKHSLTPNEFRKKHREKHQAVEDFETVNVKDIHDLINDYQKKYYTTDIDFSFLNITPVRMQEEHKIHLLYSTITSIGDENANKLHDSSAILYLGLNSGLRSYKGKQKINWEYVYVIALLSIILFDECGLSIDINLMSIEEWMNIFTQIREEITKHLGMGFDEKVYIIITYNNDKDYKDAVELSKQLEKSKFFSAAMPVYSA